MDRIEPARKHGTGLLANRYLLNDSLFNDELGTLYQARDTQAGRDSSEAHVLIHFFPSQALGYTTLKTVCERLQERGRTVEQNILAIIDCGWSGTDAFFVLEAPQSWSLKSLPAIQNARMSNLHEKAIRITDELIKKDLVRDGLHAQLFLVTPDGQLHLPGTALSENLQSQQHRKPGMLRPGLLKPEPASLPWQAIGFALAGIAVASAAGVYYQSTAVPRSTPTLTPAAPAAPAMTPITPANPLTINTITMEPGEILPSAQTRESTTSLASSLPEPISPMEPLITLSKLDTPDLPSNQPKTAVTQQAEKALSVPQDTVTAWLPDDSPESTSAQPTQTELDQPELSGSDSAAEAMVSPNSEISDAATPSPAEPEQESTSHETTTQETTPESESTPTEPELASESTEPEAKPEAKPELIKQEVKPETKPETKPVPTEPEAKPETKPEAKPNPTKPEKKPKPAEPESKPSKTERPSPNNTERRARTRTTASTPPPMHPAPLQMAAASAIPPVRTSPNIPVHGSVRTVPVPARQITPIVQHRRPTPATPVRVVPSPIPPVMIRRPPAPQHKRPAEPAYTYGGPPIIAPQTVQPAARPAPVTSQSKETVARPTPVTRPPAPRPARSQATPHRTPASRPAPEPPRHFTPSPEPVADEYDNNDESELTANGMNSRELTNRAYAAIQKGHLNEQPNVGATYFVRLLQRIDKGNPQILRLAKAVVNQYHQRARNSITNEDLEEAASILWLAARLIEEFNLVALNDSQQILEHRLMEE